MDTSSFLYVESQIRESEVLHVNDIKPDYARTEPRQFRCDGNKDHVFGAGDVVLHEYSKGINILGAGIYLLESDGTFIVSYNPANLPDTKKYYTLHCPICDEVHLFGFDLAKGAS